MSRRRRLTIGISVGFALWAAALIAWSAISASEPDDREDAAGNAIGGPFTLVQADGQSVTDKTYRGKWLLVYFGYTYCPDVCPTTLGNIAQALARLGHGAAAVTPLFVTIDPKRDTPARMGAYVKDFDSRILGLSGTPAEIAAIAKEYHVYYAAQPGNDDSYLVDHSSFIYLMTPQGTFAQVLPGSTSGADLAAAVRRRLASTS